MFVDLWIVSLFSLLFGACAYINYNMGLRKGIEATLDVLENDKIIMMHGDQVVPYREGENNV
jgi:hypothetical protein